MTSSRSVARIEMVCESVQVPKPHVVSAHSVVRLAPAEVFAGTLVMPLESIFTRRYLAFPSVTGIRDQGEPDEWGTVGQTRTVRLSDGGTLHERLLAVDVPDRFAYEIDRITGPMAPLVRRIEGEFRFEDVSSEHSSATQVTWQWTLHPRNAVTALTLPLIAAQWRGYARLMLERLEQNLTGAPR